ncbi:titin-like isoform X2 [Corticium candelabrum]|nr:titin-like isoform X2 [Corticium candelabrum]
MPEPALTTIEESQFLKSPTFVAAFPVDNYMYFLFRETAYGVDDHLVYSRVARVCLYDDPSKSKIYPTRFSSFMKARIFCSVPGGLEQPYRFDQIVDVFDHVGSIVPSRQESRLMYAIFRTPANAPTGAALCVYSFDEIPPGKRPTLKTIFNGTFIYKNDKDQWQAERPSEPYRCEPGGKPRNPIAARKYTLMQNTLQQSTDKPLLVLQGVSFTSLVVDRVDVFDATGKSKESYDVVFIGTDNGRVLKVVNLEEGLVIIEEIMVMESSSNTEGVTCQLTGGLKFTMKLDSGKGQLFLAVDNDSVIMKVSVERCHLHTNCVKCVKAQDPYCGWCEEEKRCTARRACLRGWTQDVKTGLVHNCENAGYSSPIITSFPPKIKYYVQRNNRVEFRCRAAGLPPPYLQWTRNGKVVAHLQDGKSHELVLQLPSVELFDSGMYVCAASNRIGKAMKKTELVVVAAPQIAKFPVDSNITIGQSTIFHCGTVGEPRPEVQWHFRALNGISYLPTKRVQINNRNKFIQLENGSLVVLNVSKTDVGKYRCRAWNDYEPSPMSPWASLNVAGPPKLRQLDDSNRIINIFNNMQSVVLHCPIISDMTNLPSTITWYHNGTSLALIKDRVVINSLHLHVDLVQISQPVRYKSQPNTLVTYIHYKQCLNGSLIIHPTQDDVGAWECRVTNRIGQTVQDPGYMVRITNLPKQLPDATIAFKEKPHDFKATEGQAAKFHCSASFWTKLKYKWFYEDKNGKRKQIVQDDGPRYFVSKRNSLLIFDVEKDDRGTYVCRVEGEKSLSVSREASASLTVRSANVPQLADGSSMSPTTPNTLPKSRLMCTIVSVESNGKSKVRRFASAEMRLPIDDIKEDKEFTCASHTVAGQDNLVTRMGIVAFPQFVEMPPPITAVWNLNYQVTLVCRARCPAHRSYKITWVVNGTDVEGALSKHAYTIVSNNKLCESRLTLDRIANRGGEYTCWFRDQKGGGALSSMPSRLYRWESNWYKNKQQRLLEHFVVIGSELTLICPLTSNNDVRSDLQWKHDQVPIITNSDKDRVFKQSDGSLRITNVTDSDIQTYIRCWWEGKKKATFRLRVFKSNASQLRFIKNSGYNWEWMWQLPQNRVKL